MAATTRPQPMSDLVGYAPTAIDRAISYLWPTVGYRRERDRIGIMALRDYQSSLSSRRTKNWLTTNSSGNAEAERGARISRARARDLVRNGAWGSKIERVIVSHTIGTGIVAKITNRSKARADRAADTWKQWAETTACDAQGKRNLYGLQELWMATIARDGGVLIVREVDTKAKPIPLKLRTLEVDHLDTSRDGLQDNGNRTLQGIEYDSKGLPVGYWLFDDHPGDRVSFKTLSRSRRIDAERVLHVFDAKRPGQGQGITWFAPVMFRIRDADDYADAQLLKQKMSACFVAFLTDPEGNGSKTNSPVTEKLEPGAIEILPVGRSIEFAEPPSVENYDKYMSAVLHEIAAGVGISYEALTGDLGQTSFSSGRMGWLEMHRNIESWRWNMFIPQALDPVSKWFAQLFFVTTGESSDLIFRWTPPRREMIDPKAETAAISAAIRAGLMTLPEAQREFGYDPDEMLDEIAESNSKLDAKKIILDSDPRKTTAQGQLQADPNEDKEVDETLRALRKRVSGE